MSVFRIVLPIFVLVLVPSILVYLAAGYESGRNILALTAGAGAYTLMAFNILLATRIAGLEAVFGGLDQVYRIHKWSGITVLPLILVHTQLKFVRLDGVVPPGTLAETAVTVAEPAFFVLILLIVISAIKRLPRLPAELPWEWWRITHWLIAPVFAALTFHQLFVKAPYESTSAIRIWLSLAAIIGLSGLFWTATAPWLRKRNYEVLAVNKLPEATHIVARPVRNPIRAREGQFAFLSAMKKGMRAPHPFTLSKLAQDGTIEFCIQPTGDFTRRLRQALQPGDKLLIEGGYGRFDFRQGGPRQIWLAGGIGITPFLAMAEAFAQAPENHEIVLIHAVRQVESGIGADRLKEIARTKPNFSYHLHDSGSQGRLDTEQIDALLPFLPGTADFWYCGPKSLREAVVAQWQKTGKTPLKLNFEEFEFR